MNCREVVHSSECPLSEVPLCVQLQYQALGLTDSFDERETANGPENGHLNGGGGGGGEGEGKGEGEGEGERGGFREQDLFDDPKYASSTWIEQTMLKVQRNGSPPESAADVRGPFATTKCQVRDITVHLHAKKSRRKKCPSPGEKYVRVFCAM